MEKWTTEGGPPNYHDDVKWSLDFSSQAVKGEPIRHSRTIGPSPAQGARGPDFVVWQPRGRARNAAHSSHEKQSLTTDANMI
eukprot:5231583-Pyramimonas_sp.AAC.1